MNEYNFRLLLDVPGELTDDDLDALYEATESDATFSRDDQGWSAEFDRQAHGLAKAVMTAIGQLESAPVGVRVRELVSDDEALVTAADIARRTGRSREAIRLYAEGARNRELGPFPPPVVTFASGQRVWRWGDVAPWLARTLGTEPRPAEDREAASAINDFLDLRRRMAHVSRSTRATFAQALEQEAMLLRS